LAGAAAGTMAPAMSIDAVPTSIFWIRASCAASLRIDAIHVWPPAKVCARTF
jgi:hypothetical protein